MSLGWALETGARLASAVILGRGVPFQVTISVTYRCNKKCVYCSLPDHPVSELEATEWRAILARLKRAGTRRILLYGGEPLLRDDIGELVGFARDIGLRVGLATNGSLVPDRIDAIRKLHSLTVSLDGRPASQDRTRGRGSHEEALRAVDCARRCGVPVKVNAVLCADNANDLPWLLEFSAKKRLPLVLNIIRSETTGYHGQAERHRLENETIRDMLRTIADATRTHPLLVFSRYSYETARKWPDFTKDRWTGGRSSARPPGPRCSAGRFHCMIAADGRLYPCPQTMGLYPAKSVLEDGLEAALKLAGSHDCLACPSSCQIEMNATFALNPRILWNHLTGLLRRPVY